MWNEPILGQTNTKRQHYVPRFYLKPFGRPDGKLHVSDLQANRDYVCSLENAAVQSGFYDVDLGGHAYSAEEWLGKLESDAATVLRCLIDDPSAVTTLSWEQENALARFLAALNMRTPRKRQQLDNTLDGVFSQIEQNIEGQFVSRFGEAQGLAKYSEWEAKPFHERYGEEEPGQPASVTNHLLGEVQGFANLLRAAPWRIGITPRPGQLYTSDNPVSRFLDPVRPWWEAGAFSSFHYFFPLSPEILLKVERRPDTADLAREASPWGERRKKDFSDWEISMARHIISRDAFRNLYGDSVVVSKQCAVSCLDRIELATREFAARYLGFDPNPPPGAGFPYT